MSKYIEERIKLEKRVMRKVGGNIFAAGMSIKVCCHGDNEEVGATEFHTKVSKEFIDDSTCADMIDWEVYKDGEFYSGILLVLGNDGYDVVADHGLRMSEFMPTDAEMDRYEAVAERNHRLVGK